MKRLLAGAAILIAVSWAVVAQPSVPADIAEELVGGIVFAAGGVEVGRVAGLTRSSDGRVTELQITTASPQGIGERTVILPQNSYIFLRGAVVVDLSPAEVDALPSTSPN